MSESDPIIPPLKPPKPQRGRSLSPIADNRRDAPLSDLPSTTKSIKTTISKPEGAVAVIETSGGVLLSGILSKMNREGKFEKCLFSLKIDELTYSKAPQISVTTTGNSSVEIKSLSLSELKVTELSSDDYRDAKSNRTFKLYSRIKSFYIRAPTPEQKSEWMEAISQHARNARITANMPPEIDMTHMAPIWSVPVEAASCQLCDVPFTFFLRRHHCRNCGKCICDGCSLEKARIVRLDPTKLFRVCNPCSTSIKDSRQYGFT